VVDTTNRANGSVPGTTLRRPLQVAVLSQGVPGEMAIAAFSPHPNETDNIICATMGINYIAE